MEFFYITKRVRKMKQSYCPLCKGYFHTGEHHRCAGVKSNWVSLLDAQEIVEAKQQARDELRVASDYQPKKVSG